MDRVVVYRQDRISRSLLGCASLLQELRERGVGLAIVTALELGHSPQDNLMLNILASFAEFEREMIASRIAEAFETPVHVSQRHLILKRQYNGDFAPLLVGPDSRQRR